MRVFTGCALMLGAALVVAWSGVAEPGANESTWRLVKPQMADGIVPVRTAGKTIPYYALKAGHPTEVKVDGPSRLRAMTRLQFDTEAGNTESYELRAFIDSTDRRTFRKTTRKSLLSSMRKRNDNALGKIRNVYLSVPDGTHTYRFELGPGSKDTVLMRFLVQKSDSKREWVYFSPKEFPSMAILEVNGKERTYFPVTAKDSVTVEVTGPAQVKILIRWQSFEADRKTGEAQVQVFQDGTLQATKLIRSNRTSGKVISLEKLSVIGNSRFFLLDVPEGKHTYTFRLVDSPGIAALLIRPFIRGAGGRSDPTSPQHEEGGR